MRCAFGSGRRAPERIAKLVGAAGLQIVRTVDIGWSHHLWQLTAGASS